MSQNINSILNKKDILYSSFLHRAYPEIFVKSNSSNSGTYCKTITFQVTNECNLKCTYCYQINKSQNYMTFDIAKKFIDELLINKYDKYGMTPEESPGIIFEFIGGEPFLHIELITQICDYIEDQLIELEHPWLMYHRYGISSNGTLYFNPLVQKFLNKYKHLVSLTITVDGNQKLHDTCRLFPDGSPSYELAYKAALDWKINNGQDCSKITLSPDNIIYTAEAIIHFIDSDFKNIYANCVFEEGWNNYHASIFYNELKKVADYIIDNELFLDYQVSLFEFSKFRPLSINYNNNWCGGNGAMLALAPDGILFPCIRFMDSSLNHEQPELDIGDIYSGIGSNDLYQKNLEKINNITRRSQSTDECFYCPIAAGCAWCSGYNYQKFGTLNHRATYICCMHKARALANVYYWNTLFQKYHLPKYMPMLCPKEWALLIIDEKEYNYLLNLAQIQEREEYAHDINL